MIQLLALKVLLTLGRCQSETEDGECRHERESHLDPPNRIKLAILAFNIQGILKARKDSDGTDGACQCTPPLIRENPSKQSTPALQMATFRNNCS
jgi:hypothetical protein